MRCAIENINYLEGLLDRSPSTIGALKATNKRDRVRQAKFNFVRNNQVFGNKENEPTIGKRKMSM